MATPSTVTEGSSVAAGAPVLEARGVSKHFGAITALSNVNFHVGANEIVGLIGDNGAGKSTLIKVLSGSYPPDEGELLLHGEVVNLTGPRDAQQRGIETVYQDLALFDELSIAANVFAGRERIHPSGFLKDKEMRTFTDELVTRLGVKLPSAKTIVRNLSGGQRQAVALARSVGFGSRIVIFDEPTSALSKAASEHVLEVIRDLRGHGISSIFIGHNLDHVMEVCDRIVVLRQGEVAGEVMKADFSINRLVGMMVGG